MPPVGVINIVDTGKASHTHTILGCFRTILLTSNFVTLKFDAKIVTITSLLIKPRV